MNDGSIIKHKYGFVKYRQQKNGMFLKCCSAHRVSITENNL